MKNPKNALIWIKAEERLQGKDADILLIFDCCHAGLLRRDRGCHTFEFLGACEKEETTPPPGHNSFTRALIWALGRMADEKPGGFTTLHLKNKISKYEHFATDKKQHLSLDLRERLTSKRHVFITPRTSTSSSNPSPVQAEKTTEHSTPGEWLDFRLYFNRHQYPEDIHKLARGFDEFVSDHSEQGLHEVELENKSSRIRLFAKDRWRWVVNSVRRRNLSLVAPLINPAEIIAAPTSFKLIPGVTTAPQRPALEVHPDFFETAATSSLRTISEEPGLATPAQTNETASGDETVEKQIFESKDTRKHLAERQEHEDIDKKVRRPKKSKARTF